MDVNWGDHGEPWEVCEQESPCMALQEEESSSSSERRQAGKKQAHPLVIRAPPPPEVQRVSPSTIWREMTTSSPQPGQGDKGAKTGSCLKKLRGEQPKPRPQPLRCAGQAQRGGRRKRRPGSSGQNTVAWGSSAADKVPRPRSLKPSCGPFPGRGFRVFLP